MNKIIIIIFLSFVLFAVTFSSCKNQDMNTFSGTITDMSSNEPVAGVTVILQASKLSSGSINSTYYELSRVVTGDDGSYNFECEQGAYLHFRIRLEKEGYHNDMYDFEPSDQLAHYAHNYSFARESYLYVRVLNVLPSNEDDEFKIRIENISTFCQVCGTSEFRYFYGANVDTTFLCNTVGGNTVNIYSISIFNEESIIKTNKVYCIPGDTVFFNAYF